jgi:WD40-like Beta Propeller Repeat
MRVNRMNRRASFLAVALVALGCAWMHLPDPAKAAGCANEAIRAEQGATASNLPECRAYELVSRGNTPLVDSSGVVQFGARAADDGNAMAYFSYYPFEGSPSSGWFVRARRGATGWSLEAMSPQVLPGAAPKVACEAGELNYSEDLLASVLRIGRDIKEEFPGASFCGQPQEEIVAGEPRGFANLLRRATPDSPYELVNQTPVGESPANAQFQDASDDLSHIVFGEEAQLTPEAPPGYNLYVWTGGTVRLVTFLPDGTPVRGDLAGATKHFAPGVEAGGTFNGTAPIINAVSSDGERVFFYANGNLYLRENAAQPPAANPTCGAGESTLACTRQVDRSFGEGSSGGGVFQYASADGSRVFFTDERKLTFPSSAAPGKPALYEYSIGSNALADRTSGVTGADVRGFSGAAQNGSRLYFVAYAALTGAQQNEQAEVAQAGQPNLYLLENGALTFVATLDPASDRSAWSFELTPQDGEAPTGGATTLATRTSPDGRYFAFNSARSLTGGPAGTTQIFVYDAVDGALSCASCLPGGGAPPGPSELPSPIATTEVNAPAYLPRGLTEDGRLFFTSPQALLPADTDEVTDVYEYRQGELHLISDGTRAGPSYFFDASVGAGNVFFATSDALVRSDTDNALNLYDARVDGGFAEPPAPPSPCAPGEACRSAGEGPTTGSLTTQFQAGAGNVVAPKRCKRGKVRRKGHCVKRANHRKHKQHHAGKKETRR